MTIHVNRGEELGVPARGPFMEGTAMNALVKRTRNQRGMVTAEYAAGTLATVSFAGILLKILTDPQLREALLKAILRIIQLIFGG